MSRLVKQSNFLNQRKRLLYNNGDFVQLGDRVMHQNKAGLVVGRDNLTVNIEFDDGSQQDFVTPDFLQKIAVNIVEKVVKDSYWINKSASGEDEARKIYDLLNNTDAGKKIWQESRKKFPDYPAEVDKETDWIYKQLCKLEPEARKYEERLKRSILDGLI